MDIDDILEDSESKIEQDEVFNQMVDHHRKTYDSLARDALNLLRIQLFVIPIAVSLSSFVAEVGPRFIGDEKSINIENIVNFDVAVWAGVILTASVFTTSISYLAARRKSISATRAMLERYVEKKEDILYFTNESKSKINQLFSKMEKSLLKIQYEYANIPITESDNLTNEPGLFPLYLLVVSAIGTVISVGVLIRSIGASVISQIDGIILAIVFIVLIIVVVIIYIATVAALIESVVSSVWTAFVSIMAGGILVITGAIIRFSWQSLEYYSVRVAILCLLYWIVFVRTDVLPENGDIIIGSTVITVILIMFSIIADMLVKC